MGDVNIDRMAKHLILDLCKWKKEGKLEIDYNESSFREWRRLTKLMFVNNPTIFIIEETYKISEELAEDIWKDFELPDFKEKKKSVDPSVENLSGKITIIQVAQKYGLEVKKNRSKCVFHKGNNKTSLSFNPEKNIFRCWSCGVKGDIFTFYKMLRELKK